MYLHHCFYSRCTGNSPFSISCIVSRMCHAYIWVSRKSPFCKGFREFITGSIPLGVTEKARFYGLFSCLENETAPNVRLGIEESKMLKEEILDVFLSWRVYSYGLFFYYG